MLDAPLQLERARRRPGAELHHEGEIRLQRRARSTALGRPAPSPLVARVIVHGWGTVRAAASGSPNGVLRFL